MPGGFAQGRQAGSALARLGVRQPEVIEVDAVDAIALDELPENIQDRLPPGGDRRADEILRSLATGLTAPPRDGRGVGSGRSRSGTRRAPACRGRGLRR